MLTYAIRRSLQAIPLLLLISMILFAILHAMPGGGLAAYAGNPHLTAADIERLRHNLGLDRPLYIQYFNWLWKVLHGDWGWSTLNSTTVVEAFLERLPATLELMVTSFIIVPAAILLGASRVKWLARHAWVLVLLGPIVFVGCYVGICEVCFRFVRPS